MAYKLLNSVRAGPDGSFDRFLGLAATQNKLAEGTIQTMARSVLFFYAKNLTRGVL
jgi:hypothetical protein